MKRSRIALLFLPVTLLIVQIRAFAAPVDTVDSVEITVSDMDRSVEFFSRVLTFSSVRFAFEARKHLEDRILTGMPWKFCTLPPIKEIPNGTGPRIDYLSVSLAFRLSFYLHRRCRTVRFEAWIQRFNRKSEI